MSTELLRSDSDLKFCYNHGRAKSELIQGPKLGGAAVPDKVAVGKNALKKSNISSAGVANSGINPCNSSPSNSASKNISKSVTFCLPNEYTSREENEAANVQKLAAVLAPDFKDPPMPSPSDDKSNDDNHVYDYVTADKVKQLKEESSNEAEKSIAIDTDTSGSKNDKVKPPDLSPVSDANDEYIELKPHEVESTKTKITTNLSAAELLKAANDRKLEDVAIPIPIEAEVTLEQIANAVSLTTYENVHKLTVATNNINIQNQSPSHTEKPQKHEQPSDYYNISAIITSNNQHRSNPTHLMTKPASLQLKTPAETKTSPVHQLNNNNLKGGPFRPLTGLNKFNSTNQPLFSQNFNLNISFPGANGGNLLQYGAKYPNVLNGNAHGLGQNNPTGQLQNCEDDDQGGDWQYHMCACYKSWKTSLLSCFCPCIVEHQLGRKINNNKLWQVLTLLLFLCISLLVLIVICYFGRQFVLMWACIILGIAQLLQRIFFTAILRKRVRLFRNISGVALLDCCAVCFCYPCALCQMKQEIDYWPDLHQSRT